MSEQDPAQQQAPALANIRPIGESEGQPLTSYEDIYRLVEAPAVSAVTELWDKNVGTVSSSANGLNGAYIDVDWGSLSDTNKTIARNHGLVDEADSEPQVIKLLLDTCEESTADEVAAGLRQAASIFEPQELRWAKSYSVDEMKAVYGYDPGEDLNPVDVKEYYFAPDGRFHLSKELYQKSLFREVGAETIKDPEVKLSPGQMGNFNKFLHGPVDQDSRQALHVMDNAARNMDQAANRDGVDPTAGRAAIIAVVLGSLTRNPALLSEKGDDLAGRLRREFGMEQEDATRIRSMMDDFSRAPNINRVSDIIFEGLSYVRGQKAQGKNTDLLAVVIRAGVAGAVKDPDLRASIMRDLSGNRPVY